MYSPSDQHSRLSCTVLSDVAQVIENHLTDNWVIRIEYTREIKYLARSWQQWDKAFFNVTDTSGVIDKIHSCHMYKPHCAIRLHAEKLYPRSGFYVCVCEASLGAINK
ncbi:MAG: hypothetical protein AMJ55_09670 [Gammaproteobacteria bacterium SG8_15]|jgi:ribulose bisphosphate carboxylase small subunit|nr:MAG: hypothetical protein AMJ55_09670 [Gammaproteobacteria bacterium SG8_15]